MCQPGTWPLIMDYKILFIDTGYGQKWPTDLLLLSLTADSELGDAEWWRRMAILQNAAAKASDSNLLAELNKAKEKKYGCCFPIQEVTTSQNMPLLNSLEDTIYFAPMKNLQKMMSEEWFDKVSTNKNRFTMAWRDKLIIELMNSIYRDDIAREWGNPDQRLQLKGHLLGAFMVAGVFTNSALCVARTFYDTGKENTPEVKTLAKYMGDCRKVLCTEWIKDYVKTGS